MKIGNLEVYGVIYKIINKINGKIYIGQTIDKRGFDGRYNKKGKDIERVYNYYKKKKEYYYYNNHLFNAINKYGFKSFDEIKIFDIAFSKKELDIKEECWINYFNCINNGYNNMEGGSHGSHTEKTKKKLSENHKKELNGMYGKLGKLNPLYGRKLSEETKQKISKANKGKHYHTKESKQKISEANKGENNYWYGKGYLMKGENNHVYGSHKFSTSITFSKKTICITTGKIFYSASEGARYYKCDNSNVSKCCKGSKKFCGKLLDGTKLAWKYILDLTIEEYIKYDIDNKLKKLNPNKLTYEIN